jgi:hypothetical protein
MIDTPSAVYENFDLALADLKESTPLMRPQKAQKMASQIDILARTSEGLVHLYEHSIELEETGFFSETAWANPQRQVPALVKGTLMSGHPSSSFEIASELRLLAYANGLSDNKDVSPEEAKHFIEEILVLNLEFAFDELTEESRLKLTQQERKKVVSHFKFLMQHAEVAGIKSKLAQEIREVLAQRPVVTDGVRNLIQAVYHKMDLHAGVEVDDQLQFYINALFFPGPMVSDNPKFKAYQERLAQAKPEELQTEAESMGRYLESTGLTNSYLSLLLKFALEHQPELVPTILNLAPQGIAEWEKHQEYCTELCNQIFSAYNYRGIYGLKRMLERSLFSRRAVRAGITNLRLVNMHHLVEERILKTVHQPSGEVSARQYLMGALLSILGQPLGIGQGNNATCQSARGISLWAQHAPAKLINLVTTVTTANNLIMRFENQDLESMKLAAGLVDELDHKLDAVSVVMVVHLDKIYNEMMRMALGRGEDPHKWVNPSLYGQWVQTGFASAYSYLGNSIHDFEGFVRLFYAAFHPKYNGGRAMVYPNPVGIFITSSKGEMLGFHAVSLLRIAEHAGQMRAYFLNPNNEGRQNWGQEIAPSVLDFGEKVGESSLPLHQFMARVYAFHYNTLDAQSNLEKVPTSELEEVSDLARASWGKKYVWIDTPRIW